jgi:hypothetical protein
VPPGDRAAGHHLHPHLVRALRLVHQPDPPDRLDQRGPDVRVEPVQRGGQRRRRHPQLGELDAVEATGQLADRVDPALGDRGHDRADRMGGRLDVDRGARQHAGQAGPEGPVAQVEAGQHAHQYPAAGRARPAGAP